jgi:hypothetical protein
MVAMKKKNNPDQSPFVLESGSDEYIGTAEVSQLLGKSKARVQQFFRHHQLSGIKKWNRLLFRRSDVVAFSQLDRPPGRKPSRGTERGKN